MTDPIYLLVAVWPRQGDPDPLTVENAPELITEILRDQLLPHPDTAGLAGEVHVTADPRLSAVQALVRQAGGALTVEAEPDLAGNPQAIAAAADELEELDHLTPVDSARVARAVLDAAQRAAAVNAQTPHAPAESHADGTAGAVGPTQGRTARATLRASPTTSTPSKRTGSSSAPGTTPGSPQTAPA